MAGSGSGPMMPPWGGPSQGGGWNGTSFGVTNTTPPPSGYEWDPMTGSYGRSPQGAGTRAGQYAGSAISGMGNGPGTPASLMGLITGGMGGGGGAGGGTGGNVGVGTNPGKYVAPIQMPDTTATTNAAFGRAKDQAGALARSSLDSLSGELGAQGMLGGGAQAQGAADILSGATNTMGKEISSEAGQTAGMAADFAKTGYEGSITQRGQDIQAQEAAAARNQQVLLSLLAGLRGGGGGGGGGQLPYGGQQPMPMAGQQPNLY